MVSLLTNETALIAAQILRSASADLSEAQERIATGLIVRESADNPAFFLVSQQTSGDQVVVDSIADNLEIAFQSLATAESAIGEVFDSLDRITDAITIADSGTALQELNFAVSQEIDFIRAVIDNASFNGVNLLTGSESFTPISGVTRVGGEISFQSSELRGLNLDDLTLFGEGDQFDGFNANVAGTTARDEAVAQGQALIRSFRPELADQLDLNGDGVVELEADSPDDAVQGDGAFAFSFDLSDPEAATTLFQNAPFLPTLAVNGPFNPDNNLFTINQSPSLAQFASFYANANPEFLARADTDGDGFFNPFLDDLDGNPFDTSITIGANFEDFQFFDSFNPPDLEFNSATATFSFTFTDTIQTAPVNNADPGAFPTIEETFQGNVFSSTQLREFAEGSGFSGLLGLLDVSNPFDSTAGALVVVDALRERANLAASQLGTLAQAISAQQEFLTSLSDSLSIGVSALVEADLDEEAGRVQASLVRQALAVQNLSLANSQPQSLLQLF